jgi:hypothetical protein
MCIKLKQLCEPVDAAIEAEDHEGMKAEQKVSDLAGTL